jgi:hypothetical protein
MPKTAKPAAKRAAPRVSARADFGAPIDGFIRKQPAHLRAILEELRRLVETTVPGTTAALKWGMPCFTLGGHMMAVLGGHKAHVNLVLVGPPTGYHDPKGRLEGGGKGGRHLKLERLADLPRASVRAWLRVAAAYARSKQKAA